MGQELYESQKKIDDPVFKMFEIDSSFLLQARKSVISNAIDRSLMDMNINPIEAEEDLGQNTENLGYEMN